MESADAALEFDRVSVAIVALLVSIPVQQSRGEEVTELGDVTEPAITTLGQYPDYQRDGLDKLDVTFTLSIDFDAKTEGDREVIWETGIRRTSSRHAPARP